ncbi:ABC transporter ATP-binding protein [Synechococcus sp. PCC 7336]|uniref:ABC transporter ATP-binding protein n=1 Tax=Synechococcus sp. PCC 7336 TaxID=195250 RepID=UPI000346D214|nr:ABC transporter ATP-binding protein [Synechococcus sp. PCC 7336]
MISAEHLQVTFNPGTPMETRALQGMSLTIPSGQFVTVIGSNGAGKSTLLGAIAGDIACDRGSITIAGRDVTRWPAPKRARLVARVFQDPLAGSCAHLTLAENMALAYRRGQRRSLGRALNRRMMVEFRSHLERLDLGLENRLGDRMGLLSGGQRQAVSLLMATLANREILLLDEHTAALDPKTAVYVADLTRAIVAEKGLTTLMVTHSMRQALDLGDRTLMLHEGRIVFDVSGAERASLDVPDLLRMFEQLRGEALSNDSLLLS